MYIVDASLAVKWLLPEEDSFQADAFARRHAGKLFAPSFILAEVANAVWQKVRAKKLTLDDAAQGLEEFSKTRLELYSCDHLILEALELAASLKHEAIYDCVYLALAEEMDAILVTADQRFIQRVRTSRRKHAMTLQQWWEMHVQ